eukprot:6064754-Amphidinium_carterae.1
MQQTSKLRQIQLLYLSLIIPRPGTLLANVAGANDTPSATCAYLRLCHLHALHVGDCQAGLNMYRNTAAEDIDKLPQTYVAGWNAHCHSLTTS